MKPLILIADGNSERRGRLVAALREGERELDVRATADGASALELALSKRPTVVLADSQLGLLEAPKLLEILRANPRTRAVRFLLLGGEAGSSLTSGLDHGSLPEDASIEDIVAAAESELATHRRLAALNSQVEDHDRPRGHFPDTPLLEVVHCLHVWKRSGRLDLRRSHAREARGSVWLRDGEVVDAEQGDSQGRKALYRMMAWEHGEFALDPSGLHVKRTPLAPLGPLLDEGTRQLAESERLADRLPSLDSPIGLRVRASDLPNILHPLTQEVLSLLESCGTVREVVDECSYPDYQVLRTLSTLADRQIIHLGRAPVEEEEIETETSAGDVACEVPEVVLFDDHQIRRLNEWALSGLASSSGADLKLLVAASCPAALNDFTFLLRHAPGFSLTPEFSSGHADPDSFALLGRLESETGLAIELVNVPAREEMAPLWPVAGAGALGTLFLLSGPVGEAASKLQPMSDALRQLPRSRIFNLFLFHKDEPISPAELSENLSLIDEASLFMLPLEGEKPPLELLRSVFSRVVP